MTISEVIKELERFQNECGDVRTEISKMYIDNDGLSDCCNAPIIMTDICGKCGEHCDKEEDYVVVEV